MIINTKLSDVIESFHSSFVDKKEIPSSLEMLWLEKAIGQYSVEMSPLTYDKELGEFGSKLDRYVIDILATMMKVYYMEREYSRTNKIVSIVGTDLSVNGNSNLSKYAKDELEKTEKLLEEMLNDLKPTAYN